MKFEAHKDAHNEVGGFHLCRDIIHRLATGICTVWNDNPKAVMWWRELG